MGVVFENQVLVGVSLIGRLPDTAFVVPQGGNSPVGQGLRKRLVAVVGARKRAVAAG